LLHDSYFVSGKTSVWTTVTSYVFVAQCIETALREDRHLSIVIKSNELQYTVAVIIFHFVILKDDFSFSAVMWRGFTIHTNTHTHTHTYIYTHTHTHTSISYIP
jgi:hypothetical protein